MPRPTVACCKRWSTYITMICFFLAGGIEYSVIFPTMLDYVKKFDGEEWLYGLSLSAFSISNLVTSPLYGLLYDKTKMIRLIVLFGNLFEIGGNFMYFAAYAAGSKYLILGSRFIVGLGAGAGASIFAELAQTTTRKQRTTIFSLFMAMRQLGLVIGPAFNLFLQETNFYMGPFPVNPLSSPGLFMMVLWIIVEAMFILTFFYLPRVSQDSESDINPPDTNGHTVKVESPEPSVNHVISPDESSHISTSSGILLDNGESSLQQSQDKLTKSTKDMFLYSHSVNVQQEADSCSERTPLLSSPSSHVSADSSTQGLNPEQNSDIVTGKSSVYGTTSTINGISKAHTPISINPDSTYYTSFPVTASSQDLLSSSGNVAISKVEDVGCSARVRKGFRHVYWLASEMMKEEIVVLLAVLVVTMFNQATIETFFVPMAEDLLHWTEKDISYFYSAAGVEIIIAFVFVGLVSRKLGDRWQMLMGLACDIFAYGWLIGLVGDATDKTPWVMWRFIIGGFFLLWGLPLIMVTGASLYSKALPMRIQGFGQGVRRSVFSIGAILGPLWAGGAVNFGSTYYILLGVPSGLLVLIVLMMLLSFKHLKEPGKTVAVTKQTQSTQPD